MRANIAADLETTPDRINIKATTSEGLGALGRREGLAAQAIVLLAHASNGSHGH
jgi:2-C-methyl-D-erythritol 2,4-cyclodiphosphate synthase